MIHPSLMPLLLGLYFVFPGHHRKSLQWESFCTVAYELDTSLISNGEPTTVLASLKSLFLDPKSPNTASSRGNL